MKKQEKVLELLISDLKACDIEQLEIHMERHQNLIEKVADRLFFLTSLLSQDGELSQTLLEFLVDIKKADVNYQDEKGRNSLMIFCFKGNLKMIKFLIKKGADIFRKDKQGNTAVHYCLFAKKINTDILHFFVKRGFPFGDLNKKNENILFLMAMRKISSNLSFICKLKNDLEMKSSSSLNALEVMKFRNRTSFMEFSSKMFKIDFSKISVNKLQEKNYMKRFMEIKSFEILDPSEETFKLDSQITKVPHNFLSKLTPDTTKQKKKRNLEFLDKNEQSSSEEEPCSLIKPTPYSQLFSDLSQEPDSQGVYLARKQLQPDQSPQSPVIQLNVSERIAPPSKSSFSLHEPAKKTVQNKICSLSGHKSVKSGKIMSLRTRVRFYNQKKKRLEAQIEAKLKEKRERSKKAQESLFSQSMNADKEEAFMIMQGTTGVQDPPETQSLFDKLNITREEISANPNFKEPRKRNPIIIQSKPQCLFKQPQIIKPKEDFFNLLFQNIGKEINFLHDYIQKFQKQASPFYCLIQNFFKEFLEEKMHIGKVETIGSFPNNLFLPWSDLNLKIDCTSFISQALNSSHQFKENILIKTIEEIYSEIYKIDKNVSIKRKTMNSKFEKSISIKFGYSSETSNKCSKNKNSRQKKKSNSRKNNMGLSYLAYKKKNNTSGWDSNLPKNYIEKLKKGKSGSDLFWGPNLYVLNEIHSNPDFDFSKIDTEFNKMSKNSRNKNYQQKNSLFSKRSNQLHKIFSKEKRSELTSELATSLTELKNILDFKDQGTLVIPVELCFKWTMHGTIRIKNNLGGFMVHYPDLKHFYFTLKCLLRRWNLSNAKMDDMSSLSVFLLALSFLQSQQVSQMPQVQSMQSMFYSPLQQNINYIGGSLQSIGDLSKTTDNFNKTLLQNDSQISIDHGLQTEHPDKSKHESWELKENHEKAKNIFTNPNFKIGTMNNQKITSNMNLPNSQIKETSQNKPNKPHIGNSGLFTGDKDSGFELSCKMESKIKTIKVDFKKPRKKLSFQSNSFAHPTFSPVTKTNSQKEAQHKLREKKKGKISKFQMKLKKKLKQNKLNESLKNKNPDSSLNSLVGSSFWNKALMIRNIQETHSNDPKSRKFSQKLVQPVWEPQSEQLLFNRGENFVRMIRFYANFNFDSFSINPFELGEMSFFPFIQKTQWENYHSGLTIVSPFNKKYITTKNFSKSSELKTELKLFYYSLHSGCVCLNFENLTLLRKIKQPMISPEIRKNEEKTNSVLSPIKVTKPVFHVETPIPKKGGYNVGENISLGKLKKCEEQASHQIDQKTQFGNQNRKERKSSHTHAKGTKKNVDKSKSKNLKIKNIKNGSSRNKVSKIRTRKNSEHNSNRIFDNRSSFGGAQKIGLVNSAFFDRPGESPLNPPRLLPPENSERNDKPNSKTKRSTPNPQKKKLNKSNSAWNKKLDSKNCGNIRNSYLKNIVSKTTSNKKFEVPVNSELKKSLNLMKSPKRRSDQKKNKTKSRSKNEKRTSLDERCLQSALNDGGRKTAHKSIRSSQQSFGGRLKSPPIIKTSANKLAKMNYQKGMSKRGKKSSNSKNYIVQNLAIKFESAKTPNQKSNQNFQILDISSKAQNELLSSQESFKKLLEVKRSKTSSYSQLNKIKKLSKNKISSSKKFGDNESESAISEIEINQSQQKNSIPIKNSLILINKKVKKHMSIQVTSTKNDFISIHQSAFFPSKKNKKTEITHKSKLNPRTHKKNLIFSKECTPIKNKITENDKKVDKEKTSELLFLDLFQNDKQKVCLEKVFQEYNWEHFNAKKNDKKSETCKLQSKQGTNASNTNEAQAMILDQNKIEEEEEDLNSSQKLDMSKYYFALSRSMFANHTLNSYKN